MRILINNQQAVLKKGTTIDYIMENRYFTDSDDFTLTISFPLAGCPRNISIFGHLNRKDVDNPNSAMPCTILDRHLSVKGVVAITEINETEVKVQFLAGRSVSNYSTNLDKIYINELTFSDLPADDTFSQSQMDVPMIWGMLQNSYNYGKYIAIPWINNTTGILQNKVVKGLQEGSYRMEDQTPISYMPYMLHLAKQVCEAIGFSYDFTLWENSDLKYLLCCNALPATWGNISYADALPHWSVKQFFVQLEYLLHCEFNIDTLNSAISFVWPEDVASKAGDYLVLNTIDEFSANVESELKEGEAEKPQLFTYSDACPAIHTCDWLLQKYHNKIVEIHSEDEWIGILSDYQGLIEYPSDKAEELITFNPSDKIFHFRNTYFILKVADLDHKGQINGVAYDFYRQHLVPIAQFASFLEKENKESAEVIDFVPVSFAETAYWFGYEVCLDCGEYVAQEDETAPDYDAKRKLGRFNIAIEQGEKSEKFEYFNTIFVAMAFPMQTNYGSLICQYRPFIDSIYIDQANWGIKYVSADYEYTDIFRLKQNRHYSGSTTFRDIDVKTEYHFKWIADELPNIRSMFYINGKKYVAKKITATFDDNGMSQLIKGVFYRVLK